MANKQFNSIDGYSVGNSANLVVDANSNVSGNAITATANVTAPQIISNVATGTSPLTVTSTTKVANLNVEQVDGYHADISATVSNIAVRDANANIYGNNFIGTTYTSNVATGTAPLTVTSTTRVANLNVAYANVADFINVTAPGTGTGYIVFANATTGNVAEWTSAGISSNLANNSITATTFVGALSGAATSATTAGTVTTAAQPNITSVGTLTSLGVSGAVTASTLVSNVATGTAPFVVSSTTLVANLNADALEGYSPATANTASTIALRDANGNVSANFFIGNGSQLTGISGGGGASISNGTSNINIATTGGNITMGVGGTANVMVVSTSNVQLGTGSGGNITGANVISANTGVLITGNITTVNGNVANSFTIIANAANGLVLSNNITAFGAATGNANASTITGNLGIRAISSTYTDNSAAASGTIANSAIHAIAAPTLAAANTAVVSTNAATFYIAGAPTAGTNMTITNPYSLFVSTGNAYFGGNIIGRLANGNSSVNMPAANGNINLTAAGNVTMVITGTGANITGTLNTGTSNANVGNLGTTQLLATGNVSANNFIATFNHIYSVATGISAAGSTQGTATAITKDFNVVSTVASGAGVVLPGVLAGLRITIVNTSANALLVYPSGPAVINSGSAAGAYTQPAGSRLDYISTTTSQWYTLNATYG